MRDYGLIILFVATSFLVGCGGSAGGGVKPAKKTNNYEGGKLKVPTDALQSRKSTRETAFANTFQRSQLDVGTPGKGERALRMLETQAKLADAINNGARGLKPVYDNLSSVNKSLIDTNSTTFNAALLKDPPLEEIRLKAMLAKCTRTNLPSDCIIN